MALVFLHEDADDDGEEVAGGAEHPEAPEVAFSRVDEVVFGCAVLRDDGGGDGLVDGGDEEEEGVQREGPEDSWYRSGAVPEGEQGTGEAKAADDQWQA